MSLPRRSCATMLPSVRARCTSRSHSRRGGIGDGGRRRHGAGPSAPPPAPAACGTRSRSPPPPPSGGPTACALGDEIIVGINHQERGEMPVVGHSGYPFWYGWKLRSLAFTVNHPPLFGNRLLSFSIRNACENVSGTSRCYLPSDLPVPAEGAARVDWINRAL